MLAFANRTADYGGITVCLSRQERPDTSAYDDGHITGAIKLDWRTDLQDAVVVVEWGEGLAERLSERHLDIRLERVSHSDVRIATWEWSRS